MTFPFKRYPGSIVFVDDDKTYLTVVKDIFPQAWNILTFSDATLFVEHMRSKIAVFKEIDAYQRGAIDRYKRSGLLVSEVIRFWNSFPERYSLPQVAIIDYHMPHINGIDALEAIAEWHGPKILLTGMADESTVCRAFNERIIDYYIAKQNAKLMQHIVSTVNNMLNNRIGTCGLKWNAWELSMRSEHRLLLQEPSVKAALLEFVGDDYEHVVIGNPFGVLALGYHGGVKWLQLETTSTLPAAADLARRFGASDDDVHSVRSGLALTDARINAALGTDNHAAVCVSRFQIPIPKINEFLIGAVFEVPGAGAPPAEMCYTAWHARQRQV